MTSSGSPRQTSSAPETSQLFGSPYWYDQYFQAPEGIRLAISPSQEVIFLVGIPDLVLESELIARICSAMGTTTRSRWIAPAGAAVSITPRHAATGAVNEAHAGPSGEAVYEQGPDAAREVRRLSGLPVDQLAALFPDRGSGPEGRMSRENYHRWHSGRTLPGSANLERLLALRHLFREVANRTGDVRSWLMTPDTGLDFETPYEILRRGAMSRIWSAIARMPMRATHQAITAPDGDRGVRITESLRGTDAHTPIDEADDSSDWFDT